MASAGSRSTDGRPTRHHGRSAKPRHDENGTDRVTNDALRNAAEEQMGDCPVPVRPHHDQIDPLQADVLEDLVMGGAVREPGGRTKRVEVLLGRQRAEGDEGFLAASLQALDVLGKAGLDGPGLPERVREDVHQVNPAVEASGQIRGEPERFP